jgi:hypothetical protein
MNLKNSKYFGDLMKRALYINLSLIACLLFFTQLANACTGFGAITESGTIIGKNRDYFYVPQKFGLVMPIPQFYHWHDNPYHHNNQFYALTSAESVSMGVNQNGLSAVEQDSLKPQHAKDAKEYKLIQQQEGTPDGMVLYGILQNFNTVDEMIPYLSKIFSAAAPDFYQFADARKILTVEVAYGKNNTDSKHKFTYHILSQKNDYFTHTNTYLSPEFDSLNNEISNQDSLNSTKNRLKTLTDLISHAKVRDINAASRWFLDTSSNVSSKNNPNECLNTSLFRTDLQGFKSVNKNMPNDKIAGTVATMIVSNHGDFKNSPIYVMMINSITVQSDGKQLIKYDELHTTLKKLFGESKPTFVAREFMRNPPINGICN